VISRLFRFIGGCYNWIEIRAGCNIFYPNCFFKMDSPDCDNKLKKKKKMVWLSFNEGVVCSWMSFLPSFS
jgi:hypothetical protein